MHKWETLATRLKRIQVSAKEGNPLLKNVRRSELKSQGSHQGLLVRPPMITTQVLRTLNSVNQDTVAESNGEFGALKSSFQFESISKALAAVNTTEPGKLDAEVKQVHEHNVQKEVHNDKRAGEMIPHERELQDAIKDSKLPLLRYPINTETAVANAYSEIASHWKEVVGPSSESRSSSQSESLIQFLESPHAQNEKKVIETLLPVLTSNSMAGIDPLVLCRSYMTLSRLASRSLRALNQDHWAQLLKWSQMPLTHENKADPEALRSDSSLYLEFIQRVITDRKRLGIPSNARLYQCLYIAYGKIDLRKSVASHEIVRGMMWENIHASDKGHHRLPFMPDINIRTLLWLLLYCQHPGLHRNAEQTGILRFPQSSPEAGRSLVDIGGIVEDLYQDMNDFKISASTDTLLAFVEAFGYLRDKEMLETVHKRFVKEKRFEKTDASMHSTFLIAHERCGNHSAALRLFDTMGKHGLLLDGKALPSVLRSYYELNKYWSVMNTLHSSVTKFGIKAMDDDIELYLQSLIRMADSLNKKETVRYFKAAHSFIHESITFQKGLSTRSLIGLITAASSLGFVRESMLAYDTLKKSLKTGLEVRKKRSTETPRKSIAEVLGALAYSSKDLTKAADFFRNELLTTSRTQMHWNVIAAGVRKKLSPNAAVPIRVGENGPFGVCYKAMEEKYREGVEVRAQGKDGLGGGGGRGEELMHLEEVVRALKDEEEQLVKQCLDDIGVPWTAAGQGRNAK